MALIIIELPIIIGNWCFPVMTKLLQGENPDLG